MYKFLPEQIKNLEEQFEIENRKFNDILEIRKEDYLERKTGQGNETIVIFDNSLLDKSFKNAIELNDIKNKLLNCEIIESSNSDEIGIGSTCEISFDENDKNLILTLIETRLPRDPSNFISISSPLGKAIVGKKTGDSFNYSVENSVISGKINEIIKTSENTKTKTIGSIIYSEE